jgi:phosphatidylglycerol:prolipoprotein diacylglycerol transferase
LGVDPDVTMTFIFWGFVPGILGGRLFYVIWKWHEFQRPGLMATLGEMINITQGGLVVYGALIGGLLGFTAFLIKQRLPILAMLDIVTPGMLLGLALGRVGCFLNGCCFGGACELPWAVRFPAGSPPFVHEVQEGKIPLYGLKLTGPSDEAPVISEVEAGSPADILGLKPGQTIAAINGVSVKTAHAAQWVLIDALRLGKGVAIKTIESKSPVQVRLPQPRPRTRPIHPTQLYSSLDALVLCLFLVAYGPFKRRDGELIALLCTLYPINRFLMEFIRTDEAKVLGTPLKVPQVVSLLFLALVAGLWWYILRKPPGKAFPAAEG